MNKIKKLFFIGMFFITTSSVFSQGLFIGTTGNFDFPFNSKSEKSFGLGGGGIFQFGYNFGLMDLFIKTGYSYTSGQELIVKSSDFKTGLGTSFYFDNDNFSFMPQWLRIRPEVSVLADFFNTDFYRTISYKELNLLENQKGVTCQLNTSLYFDFPNLIKFGVNQLVPTIGYDCIYHFDKSGLIVSNECSLGVRLYFGKKIENPDVEDLEIECKPRFKYFSPNDDGKDDLAIFDIKTDADKHGGIAEYEFSVFDPESKLFYTTKGKKLSDVFEWNGKNKKGETVFSGTIYQYVLQATAKDGAKGVVPGIINVDLMLQKVEGGLNIIIPSINFAADSATFKGLSEVEIKQNNELLDRLAEILKEYADYSVEISGHANNVSGTEEENTKELIPLSAARAETIKNELIKRGINKNRITCVGKGSSEPLATGKFDTWKNRRVEILLKENQ